MLRSLALPLGFLVLAATGCGGGTGTLSGTVSYKNTKLTQGTVSVVNAKGDSAMGTIEADGTYRIEDCPTGKLKIAVSSPDPKETARRAAEAQASGRNLGPPPPAPTGTPPDPSKWVAIPEAYGQPDFSGLTVEVSSGANVHNIVLE